MTAQVVESANIASALPQQAARAPHQLAVVEPHGRDSSGRVAYTHLTYRQLNERSDALARGLVRMGIGRGTRTVLMMRPSLDFFAITFALFKAGAVPVMVDPGMGIGNLGQCLREAEPEAFIGIAKAHLARKLFGWGRRTIRTTIGVGPGCLAAKRLTDVLAAGKDGPAMLAPTSADEMAAILFTSGSTGVPKGAVYTHRIFLEQVRLLRELFAIEPGEIDLPTFPLFALFGPALGMTAIIPDMDASRPGQADPAKLIEAIEDFGVTNMFGSPALIDRLGRFGVDKGVHLSCLRRVISAGAPVSADVLGRMARLLESPAEVHTPYGATEALPVSLIASNEILAETRERTARGAGVCVGRPVPGTIVRIIQITDEPIDAWRDDLEVPAGTIGEIAVQGPVVTREYFRREASTRLAKIPVPSGGVFHRMGDVGYFDEQGRLWFCGRKGHRVQTSSGTLFTIPCEAVFNQHPLVRRTALVGVPLEPPRTPVLCVELTPDGRHADRAAIRRELLEMGARFEHTRGIERILFHQSFPVDVRHNAKIFREKLAVWAATQPI